MILASTLGALLAAALCGCSQDAAPADDPADDAIPSAETLVDAELLCETDGVAPGQQVTLGVRFTVDPGWHMYGDAASDSGNPPQLRWTLPEGARVGEVAFPVAERYEQPGPLLDHVYHDTFMLLAPFTAPARASPGDRLTVELHVDYLVCDAFCLMGSQTLRVTLPVTAAPAAPSADAGPFAAARARLPGPPRDDVRVEWSDQAVTITVPGAERLEFHPSTTGVSIDDLAGQGAADGDRLELPLDPWGPGGDDLLGVLLVTARGADHPTSHRLHAAGPPSQGR